MKAKQIKYEYDIANLYISIKNNSGEHTLVFYKKDENNFPFAHITGEIKFGSFNSAYKYINDNDIKVYNISNGSYKAEIEKYNKTIGITGQMTLF